MANPWVEGEAISVAPNTVMEFGKEGFGWVSKLFVSGTGTCNEAEFGSDPAGGQVKTCRFQPAEQTPGVLVAEENEFFATQVGTVIRFGADTRFNYATMTGTTAQCDIATFGGTDPAPFTVKACYVDQAAPSGATGTLGVTEENDTQAATGTITGPFTGTIAVTEQDDTQTATGQEVFSGTSATTEQNDTNAATGTVANPATGTIATTEENDTQAASGTASSPASGTITITEQDDTQAAAGTVANPVSGAIAVIEQDDTQTATGTGGVVEQPTLLAPYGGQLTQGLPRTSRKRETPEWLRKDEPARRNPASQQINTQETTASAAKNGTNAAEDEAALKAFSNLRLAELEAQRRAIDEAQLRLMLIQEAQMDAQRRVAQEEQDILMLLMAV